MNKQQLRRLIRESRTLMRTATPEQKVRLLSLIRESYRKIKAQQLIESQSIDTDYLDEK